MTEIPYLVSGSGNNRTRVVGGRWKCSDEDALWALAKEWSLSEGYVRESGTHGQFAHRLIMERVMNCLLATDEEVHHKDEDRQNNQRLNLEVKKKAEHNRHQHSYRQNGLPVGVSWHKRRQRYQAQIVQRGKKRWVIIILRKKLM